MMPPPRSRLPTAKKPDMDFPASNDGNNMPGNSEGTLAKNAEAEIAVDSGKRRPSDGGFKVPAMKPKHSQSLPAKESSANEQGELSGSEAAREDSGPHIDRLSGPSSTFQTELIVSTTDAKIDADPKSGTEAIEAKGAPRSGGGEETKVGANKADGVERRIEKDAKPSSSKPAKTVKTAYSEPEWAAKPVSAFSIEVLKDGTFVENLDV